MNQSDKAKLTNAYRVLSDAGIADGVPVECKKIYAPRQKSAIEVLDMLNVTMGLPSTIGMLGRTPDARMRF